MTTLEAVRPYWRIPAIALLSAAVAFAGSYLVSPTYTATTRLLIHGRDATFLSSTGEDLTGQPGVVDSALAKSLAETYGGVATSRSTAIAVVDRLDLDAPSEDSGIVHALAAVTAWTYRCTRAFITFGFCASVERRERVIAEVQEGTSANQLGSTAGQSAGTPGSYVLEVSGSGKTGEEAAKVTNVLADHVVATSDARFRSGATKYVSALEAQVNQAAKDQAAADAKVTAYEAANGLSAADVRQTLDTQSFAALQGELQSTQAELADAEAQLSATEAELDTTSSGSSGFNALTSQRNQLKAKVSGLQARVEELQAQIAGTDPTGLTPQQAELARLVQDQELARGRRSTLAVQLQEARTRSAVSGTELSRIDEASAPAYPVAPKRYLYLALGLLLGGLAGGGLTWRARRRGDPVVPVLPVMPAVPDAPAPQEPEPAGAADGWDLLADLKGPPATLLPIDVREPEPAGNGALRVISVATPPPSGGRHVRARS
jgi:uncharacterized protein involved in exopolysaccharide biosynthesis